MANNGKNENGENHNEIAENDDEDSEDDESNTINCNAIVTSRLTQGGKGKNGWSAKGIKLHNNMFAKVVAD